MELPLFIQNLGIWFIYEDCCSIIYIVYLQIYIMVSAVAGREKFCRVPMESGTTRGSSDCQILYSRSAAELLVKGAGFRPISACFLLFVSYFYFSKFWSVWLPFSADFKVL